MHIFSISIQGQSRALEQGVHPVGQRVQDMLAGGSERRPAAAVRLVLRQQLPVALPDLCRNALQFAGSGMDDALVAGGQPVRQLLPLPRADERSAKRNARMISRS